MATFGFITLSPNTGTGTTTISTLRASENTGRSSRSKTFAVSGTGGDSGVSGSNKLIVTQDGQTILSLNNPGSIGSGSANVPITGEANLQKLKLSLNNGASLVSATINGVTLTQSQRTSLTSQSGYELSGDPGATAKYNISLTVNVPANSTISTKTYNVTLSGVDVGPSKTVTITQNAEAQTYAAWFSSSSSGTETTSPLQVSLDSDGNVVGGSSVYVRTIPESLGWTVGVSND